MKLIIKSILTIALIGSTSFPMVAWGDDYPSKPITIVIGFPPGTATDTSTRMIANHLSKKFGQPVLVDNRPGAGGVIAVNYVAKAPPDGYTLLVSGQGPMLIAPVANPQSVKFDALKDFAPIARTHVGLYVLTARPGRFASFNALLDEARGKPGSINYGTIGLGTSSHLQTVLFEEAANIRMTHIPYKGSVQSLSDVSSGQLDVALETLAASAPLIAGKKLVPLAITGYERSTLMPSVPTIAELGVKGLEEGVWIGFFAPARTPATILTLLNQAITESLKDEAVVKVTAPLGMEAKPLSEKQFEDFLRIEAPKQADLVRKSGAIVN